MARTTRRTRRKMTPLARKLAEVNNLLANANQAVARLIPLIEAVEHQAEALDQYMVSLEGTEEGGDGEE